MNAPIPLTSPSSTSGPIWNTDRGYNNAADAATAWFIESGWVLLTSATAGLVAACAAVEVARRWRARRQLRRWQHRARLVTILPPPQVDPAGATALWANLIGLLRPRGARLWHGQPHLAFEYHTCADGIQIRMWIPGPIPPGLAERAISAAWPGARTHTTPAPTTPSAPPRRASRRKAGVDAGVVVEGGVLRLARGDGLPIAHQDSRPDPIRALLAAPGPLGPGETAWVQILARPITGHRLARATRAGATAGAAGVWGWLARALLGALVALLGEILDILTPGPTMARRAPLAAWAGARAGGSPAGIAGQSANGLTGPRERLVASAENRAAAAKTRGGAYATLVRYATTTPIPHPPEQGGPEQKGPEQGGPEQRQHGTTALTAKAPEAVLERARARARAVARGRAHAIATAFAGFSDHNHYRRRRLRHPLAALAERRLGRGDVLSVAELAAIAHLPADEHVPGLRRAGAAAIAPPPQIPLPGPGVKLLGDSDATPTATPSATPAAPPGGPAPIARPGQARPVIRGRYGRPVGLSVADSRHHLHVIGPTGTGKSTLLARLVLDDAAAGRGVLVIDPKGDLVTDITRHLPGAAYRQGRVVVLDPDSSARPPCLNPLAPHPAAMKDIRRKGWAGDEVVTENVVSVFSRLFAANWGPRTDDVLRVSLLTLRAGGEVPTLAQIPRLLTDPATRYRATQHLRHPLLLEFWRTYERLSDRTRAQAINPLLNKLRAVLLRPFAWQVLAAGPSTVSLPHILDHGGVLLARLPKGRLGEDTTRLIGSLILAQAWQATTARATQPGHRRRDASIVLDECQNFLNLPYTIEDMLAEARGFAVSITLAHQHLAQLPRELREGISANARNKIFFTVGPDDARDLARHTRPELSEHDLAHLDVFHAAARLLVAGAETPAFTLTTRPLPRRYRRAA